MYTIKTVTSLTGLSTETLRAWERRYGTIKPERDEKGRRLYSQDDVDRLNLLGSATRQGFTISKITDLDNEALQQLIATNNSPLALQNEELIVKIVDAIQQYRMDLCEDLLRRALVAMDPLSYAQDILLPALHKVGNLWHEDKISIAQEHMFSASVKRLVLSMVNSMQSFSGVSPGIMFATLSGERHEFGILLTCLLAVHHRCTAYYLGSDLPWNEILTASRQLKPSVIIISLVNTSTNGDRVNDLKKLDAELPEDIQVWIGGVGAKNLIERDKLPQRYCYISDLAEFNCRIQKLMTEAPRR